MDGDEEDGVSVAISVEGLRKSYGELEALRGLEFEINRGEVVGLLGPNGAGKSTAMKILTGFLAPTAGEVKVHGESALEHPTSVSEKIGYLPEAAPIYPEMRVGEYLEFVANVRGMGKAERARAIERALERCSLTDRVKQPIGTLSKGLKQRVGLAQAILHEPEVLILDEPTSGLDPNQIQEIRALIREVGERKTVLLSTHILSEVQASCDRVIIINRGEVVADGPTEEVTRQGEREQINVTVGAGRVSMAPAEIIEALAGVEGVEGVREEQRERLEEGAVALTITSAVDVRRGVSEWIGDHGLVVLEMRRERQDLEEVFRRLTS